jgi:hypothetical protein
VSRHRHHWHPRHDDIVAGFIFFTNKEHRHMAIITNLAIGASGVAHAVFVDANVPPNSVTPSGAVTWSASNADATVTPRSDGLTADVTRLTANPYVVTASAVNKAGVTVTGSADLPLPVTVPVGDFVSASIGFTDV